MKNKIFKIIILIIGIIFNLFIFSQSMLSGNTSGGFSLKIVNIINNILRTININIDLDLLHLIVRKLAHFTEFFILGFIWFFIYKNYFKLNKTFILTLIHGAITALLDEGIQLFIDGRGASLFDSTIDFTGVFTITLILFLIFKRKEHLDDLWKIKRGIWLCWSNWC